MNKVAGMNAENRSEIFRVSGNKLGISESAIEKDFWVCWVLKKVFEEPTLANQVLFKGGTSLSKCFGLIDRLSEDIDLILDWNLLTDENPYEKRSNTQQDKFNKHMESTAQEYVKSTLLPQVSALMQACCTVALHPEHPRSIEITYPRAFSSKYIKPQIELEISPMSSMAPSDEYSIQPYCADVLPDQFELPTIAVKSIKARKTFWDKVSILHVEAHRPEDKAQPPRYSRHYYDLYRMLRSEVKDEALADIELLRDVINFKAKFYPQAWANYKGAAEGDFKLFPQPHTLKILRNDYVEMEEMIFGDYPEFDEIMSEIVEFNSLLVEAYKKFVMDQRDKGILE